MNAKVINMTGITPILSRLESLRERKIFSFHALPISSYGNSDIIGDPNSEISECPEGSFTGELFDNFFFPSGIISESQKMTAGLYNADSSFYITSGTSIANQIAISALCKKEIVFWLTVTVTNQFIFIRSQSVLTSIIFARTFERRTVKSAPGHMNILKRLFLRWSKVAKPAMW